MDVPILGQTVDRRASHLECGQLVGTMAIKLKETQKVEYVSFRCTGPKGHRDACAFVGVDLIVTRRRREDGR